MNEQIEAIRNEIKRLEEIHERNLKKPMERGRIGYAHGVVACCDRILSFIDSLPEEKPSKDVEEAADDYAVNTASYYYEDEDDEVHSNIDELKPAFIAGAQWKAEQNDKDISEKIAAAYQLGLANKEEQMLKEAVEAEVFDFSSSLPQPYAHISLTPNKYHTGDKVRIIIVKEDAQ